MGTTGGREPSQRLAIPQGPTRAPHLHTDARRANLAAREGVEGMLRMRSELELHRADRSKKIKAQSGIKAHDAVAWGTQQRQVHAQLEFHLSDTFKTPIAKRHSM